MKLFIIFILSVFCLSGCTNNSNTSGNYNAEKSSYNATTASKETELSSFTTIIYTKTPERQNNVKLACEELDNTIVEPETTFSFCDALRSRKT